MPQIAKVIVDVPTMQTNRPYDYQVPDTLLDHIQPGMRVAVPFGKGDRLIQGFILTIQDQANFEGQLKPITAVIDLQPAVNSELLQLSSWLAERTYAFQITCLQTMLPSVMRAKYSKTAQLVDEIDPALQASLFNGNDELTFDQSLAPDKLKQLMHLQRQGKLEVVYHVDDRARVKQLTAIEPALSFEQLEEARTGLRKSAQKQQQLISYLQSLIGQPNPLLKDVLATTIFTRENIKTGADKGWLRQVKVEAYRNPYPKTVTTTQKMALTDEQKRAVDAVVTATQNQSDRVFLVEGITGSGKTEVYLQTIDAVLQQAKTALMLVPEIALTPQMVKRVKGRFGDQVAVLHSGLSEGEKYDEWRRIERKEASVVVGARSAVFAPLENIGVIIMDEEHEASYKQDESPRYHARDVAIWRSQYHHCPVILGSATPSLESRARAQKGVYQLLRLTQRINQQPLPAVELVDMRVAMKQQASSNFSPALLDALKDRLQKGEQSVLLLNRRGFSSFIMCRDCGFVLQCPNCDISLTLHMDTHSMKCHYCGHEEAIPRTCPNCQSRQIRYFGTGTQKVEAELQELIPTARILRMDVDTTRKKGAHAKLLKRFGDHDADILLGTQMIAKGLDFPDVTLVGVINADTALGLPDFRASERTFQLLTQVSGRAGRADKTGAVIVQSFNPENYAIQFAKQHDYEGFYQYEMAVRHRGGYPPYYFTVQLTISHPEEALAAKKSFQIARQLRPVLSDQAIVLGPTPKSIARINNRYFYQIVIKYKQEPQLQAKLAEILETTQIDTRHGFKIGLDNEPLQFT
ncbi:primosomal protein N' [Latilactobacillus graminis]|uniref:Replication restart protein PriA n=2 Tax=Latilactobacillus graminis TaxID=60519 RepID=A0AA89I1P3_9LACO|nr:primosomal protein N' [Latilactobacillus graminis]KRM23972.1 primosomal protein N [Latilactobacillus graminis DSM 20719]QFP79864.1 primosomal protein N' [Latilactobacillus graminis]